MDTFSSNFLQNLKLFWQFVGNFDKQCFLIISHKRILFFVGYFHWSFLTAIEFSGLFTGTLIFMGQTSTAGASATWSHSQRADHSTHKVSRGKYSILGLQLTFQLVYEEIDFVAKDLYTYLWRRTQPGRQNFILISFASRHYFPGRGEDRECKVQFNDLRRTD